jgi:hypothetical protein
MQTTTSASDLYFPEAEVRSQKTESGNPLPRFAALRPLPHLLCVRSSRRAKNPELAVVHFVAEQFLNFF